MSSRIEPQKSDLRRPESALPAPLPPRPDLRLVPPTPVPPVRVGGRDEQLGWHAAF